MSAKGHLKDVRKPLWVLVSCVILVCLHKWCISSIYFTWQLPVPSFLAMRFVCLVFIQKPHLLLLQPQRRDLLDTNAGSASQGPNTPFFKGMGDGDGIIFLVCQILAHPLLNYRLIWSDHTLQQLRHAWIVLRCHITQLKEVWDDRELKTAIRCVVQDPHFHSRTSGFHKWE